MHITSLTREEQEELNIWVSDSEENARLYNRFIDKGYVAKKMLRIWAVDRKAGWKRFKQDHNITENLPFRVVSLWCYAVAAAVLIIVAGLVWYFLP
jgi:hypothetical protein